MWTKKFGSRSGNEYSRFWKLYTAIKIPQLYGRVCIFYSFKSIIWINVCLSLGFDWFLLIFYWVNDAPAAHRTCFRPISEYSSKSVNNHRRHIKSCLILTFGIIGRAYTHIHIDNIFLKLCDSDFCIWKETSKRAHRMGVAYN